MAIWNCLNQADSFNSTEDDDGVELEAVECVMTDDVAVEDTSSPPSPTAHRTTSQERLLEHIDELVATTTTTSACLRNNAVVDASPNAMPTRISTTSTEIVSHDENSSTGSVELQASRELDLCGLPSRQLECPPPTTRKTRAVVVETVPEPVLDGCLSSSVATVTELLQERPVAVDVALVVPLERSVAAVAVVPLRVEKDVGSVATLKETADDVVEPRIVESDLDDDEIATAWKTKPAPLTLQEKLSSFDPAPTTAVVLVEDEEPSREWSPTNVMTLALDDYPTTATATDEKLITPLSEEEKLISFGLLFEDPPLQPILDDGDEDEEYPRNHLYLLEDLDSSMVGVSF
jgi:hypothetical protein